MGLLRRRLEKLEEDARGHLEFLDLPSGSSYYFSPEDTAIEMFMYGAESIRADLKGEEHPPVPEALRVVASLPTREERERGFSLVYGPTKFPFAYFDIERFFETGEIVPHKRRSNPEPSDAHAEEDEGVITVEPQR